MAIELHCPVCRKLIRAPENAAGKRGKCPYCEKDLYIPSPVDETEDIPLAPLDKEEERRAEELRRESSELAASLGREPAAKYDTGPSRKGDAAPKKPIAGAENVDIPAEVKKFVLAMGEVQLEKAEAIANRLKSAGKRASDYVQGMLVDQMPPKIGKIPEPLMRGFLKALSERLAGK